MADRGRPPDTSHELFELGTRRRPDIGATEQKETSLIAQLRELESEFREIGRTARTVAEGLSHGQVNWRPGSGQWSMLDSASEPMMFRCPRHSAIDH
jgi:hypothetical protein